MERRIIEVSGRWLGIWMNLKHKHLIKKICKLLAKKPIYMYLLISNDALEIYVSHSAISIHIVITLQILKQLNEQEGYGKEGDH